jgi:hypothetical protein
MFVTPNAPLKQYRFVAGTQSGVVYEAVYIIAFNRMQEKS